MFEGGSRIEQRLFDIQLGMLRARSVQITLMVS